MKPRTQCEMNEKNKCLESQKDDLWGSGFNPNYLKIRTVHPGSQSDLSEIKSELFIVFRINSVTENPKSSDF